MLYRWCIKGKKRRRNWELISPCFSILISLNLRHHVETWHQKDFAINYLWGRNWFFCKFLLWWFIAFLLLFFRVSVIKIYESYEMKIYQKKQEEKTKDERGKNWNLILLLPQRRIKNCWLFYLNEPFLAREFLPQNSIFLSIETVKSAKNNNSIAWCRYNNKIYSITV